MEAHSKLNVYTCRVNFGGNSIGAVHENSFVLFGTTNRRSRKSISIWIIKNVVLNCASFGYLRDSCSLKHRNSHFLSVEYLLGDLYGYNDPSNNELSVFTGHQ